MKKTKRLPECRITPEFREHLDNASNILRVSKAKLLEDAFYCYISTKNIDLAPAPQGE